MCRGPGDTLHDLRHSIVQPHVLATRGLLNSVLSRNREAIVPVSAERSADDQERA